MRLSNDILELYPFFSDVDNEVPEKVFSVPLSNFTWSVRARNVFDRENISTLYDLLKTKKSTLFSFRAFGRNTYDEARAIIKDYIATVDIDDTSIRSQEYFPLLRSINTDSFLKEKLVGIDVKILPLSVRARHVVDGLEVENISDLLMCNEDRVMAVRACGKRTLVEIKDVVANFLEEFKAEGKAVLSLEEVAKDIYNNMIKNEERMTRILKSDVNYKIYCKRVGVGFTKMNLESIGNEHNLTRERVRQIAAKCSKTLYANLSYAHKKAIDCFVAHLNEVKLLCCCFNDLNDEAICVMLDLLENVLPDYHYDFSTSVWYRGNWETLNEKIDQYFSDTLSVGATLSLQDISYHISELLNKIFSDPNEQRRFALEKLLMEYYLVKKGDWYFYKKAAQTNIWEEIIKKHFKDGVMIYKEMTLLIDKAKQEYNDVIDLTCNERALIGRILRSDNLILWDWGKYIHVDNVQHDESLLMKAKSWLDDKFNSGAACVSLHGFITMNESECIAANIPNEHALYTLMRKKYANEYYFKKDPLVYPSLDAKSKTLTDVINDYAKSNLNGVAKKDMLLQMGIKEFQLINVVAHNDKLALLGNKLYHLDNYILDESVIGKIEAELKDLLNLYGHTSIDLIFKSNIVLLRLANIKHSNLLYAILAKELANNFEFPRCPYILSKDHNIDDDGRFSFNDIVGHFFSNKERIVSQSELEKYFVTERHYNPRRLEHITYVCENVIKYSKDAYVTLELICWNDEKKSELESLIKKRFEINLLLMNKPYVTIDELLESDLPRINEKCSELYWQGTLLKSLVSSNGAIQLIGSNRNVLLPENNHSIDTADDVVCYILKDKFKGAANLKEFEKYIHNAGLSKSIKALKLEFENIEIKNKQIYIKV